MTTRTFCEICDKQLGSYDGWWVTVTDRRRGKPLNTESIGLVCDDCAGPALEVVRAERIKEFA
jgi:hypothetical protein